MSRSEPTKAKCKSTERATRREEQTVGASQKTRITKFRSEPFNQNNNQEERLLVKKKSTRKCYVCGKAYVKKVGNWFYKPPVFSGKAPKDLGLCKEHAKTYMNFHYSWKNVKRTIAALKKK